MLSYERALLGAGGLKAEPLYTEDVFNTYLYTGNGSSQTITNGIDLAGEGGLVWIKNRSSNGNHTLVDTVRGATKFLMTNSTFAQQTTAQIIPSFTSSGFETGSDNQVAVSPDKFTSWTFRKAPGFFDVVTYTGNGTSGRTIAHTLGSVPGTVIIKCTSAADDWWVWHRSISTGNLSGNNLLKLNSNDAAVSRTYIGTVNSSTFEVGSNSAVNGNGATYVAYLFAHDAQVFGENGDQSIVKCGSYSGTGGTIDIDLGWEAQWVLIKNTTTATTPWQLFDVKRGMAVNRRIQINPDLTNPEFDDTSGISGIYGTPTGFGSTTNNTFFNNSGSTHAYIAIRRAFSPPETAADSFATTLYVGNPIGNTNPKSLGSQTASFGDGFLTIFKDRESSQSWGWFDTYRSHRFYQSNDTAAEVQDGALGLGSILLERDGNLYLEGGSYFGTGSDGANRNYVAYSFRRSPGVFEVLSYIGNGSSTRNVPHGLGATPEFIIVKVRTASNNWAAWHSSFASTEFININNQFGKQTAATVWNGTPTSTTFAVGSSAISNTSGVSYSAYLFASSPGISKVGTYTGSSSTLNIDCGFTSGASFVVVKRTDTSGSWYVWDSARGIVSGNDPYSEFWAGGSEITTSDLIDPYSPGFSLPGGNSGTNTAGGTYIFLAFA